MKKSASKFIVKACIIYCANTVFWLLMDLVLENVFPIFFLFISYPIMGNIFGRLSWINLKKLFWPSAIVAAINAVSHTVIAIIGTLSGLYKPRNTSYIGVDAFLPILAAIAVIAALVIQPIAALMTKACSKTQNTEN